MLFAPLLWALLLSAPAAGGQQVTAADLDQILERADKLLDESKAAYEAASASGRAEGFVDAGFKLEEARIKYIVLQEIGGPDKQKLAADRLRGVNQLSKLIHDGRVAISGARAGTPASKPAEPPANPEGVPAPPEVPKAKAAPNVSARAPVPDAAKQKEAEKLVKDLFKDLYAKKDRKGLIRAILDQSAKSQDDPPALWVLYREAQDLAVQGCDVKLAIDVIDATARVFDIDPLAAKGAALAAAAKTAKEIEEFAFLAEALLNLIDDLISADQYEPAEKSAAAALQHAKKSGEAAVLSRAASRVKEVAEARTLFQGMKKNLELLAKTPDDPGANLEMGRFLCFVKGNWDLGLRFIQKGSDPAQKQLAEKELGPSPPAAERIAAADGWWDLAEKEKSPLRKGQMQAHCRTLYEASVSEASSLVKAKIEKRLEQLRDPATSSPSQRPSRKVTITKAKFSAGSKTFDLVRVLQEAFDKNPYTPIRCDDYLVAGENTLGQAKSMVLEGTIEGQALKETLKDGEVFVFPRIPTDGAASPKASQRFAIIEAQFGVGVNWVDVTDNLRSKLSDPYTTIQDSIVKIDPFPGKVKTLAVVFEFRGRRYLRWLSDGDSMSLLRK
jgi:hypothetical protein